MSWCPCSSLCEYVCNRSAFFNSFGYVNTVIQIPQQSSQWCVPASAKMILYANRKVFLMLEDAIQMKVLLLLLRQFPNRFFSSRCASRGPDGPKKEDISGDSSSSSWLLEESDEEVNLKTQN
jgi:hypothetical protein